MCLVQFKAKDAWTPQLTACRAAAQVVGSCREQFATDEELNRHVTVFRNLAKKYNLSAKTKSELARLYQKQEPAAAEIQLRATAFPFDFLTLTRSDLCVVSPQTGTSTPKANATQVYILEEQGTR